MTSITLLTNEELMALFQDAAYDSGYLSHHCPAEMQALQSAIEKRKLYREEILRRLLLLKKFADFLDKPFPNW